MITRENNIDRSDISNSELSAKLKKKFISTLKKRLQSYKAGKN